MLRPKVVSSYDPWNAAVVAVNAAVFALCAQCTVTIEGPVMDKTATMSDAYPGLPSQRCVCAYR